MGKCANLEVLKLNNNILKSLTLSMSKLSKLRKLVVFTNRLHDLIEDIGK